MTQVQRRRAEKLKESQRVAAELVKMDLPLPAKPRTSVPDLAGLDLTDLEDGELMDHLVILTRWGDYSGAQLALADVDEKYATSYLDLLKAKGLVETSGSGKVTVARAERQLDDVYQKALQEQLNCYAHRKLLQARHEAFERDAAVISRELTRRVERDPSTRRTARMGGAR